ncbi:hypothetical protein KY366_08845 [Candidatus Woesearchaeota archaeon]|nr:hypothetical protein [Candidatus Woesearchaeota archaeon]
MKNKKKSCSGSWRIYSKLVVGILVAATLLLFAVMYGIKQDNILGALLMVIIALTIAVFFVAYTVRELKSVKKGLPVEDERSRKVMNLAFAKAYLISIWYLLILSWLADSSLIRFRDASQALGMGILGMAILFGLCWLYYNRKQGIGL